MTVPLRLLALPLLLVLGVSTLIGCSPDRSSYYGDFHPLEVYHVKQDLLLEPTGAWTHDPDTDAEIPLYGVLPAAGATHEQQAHAMATLATGTTIKIIGAFKNVNQSSHTYGWVDIRARVLDGPSEGRITSIAKIAGDDPTHRHPDPRYLERQP